MYVYVCVCMGMYVCVYMGMYVYVCVLCILCVCVYACVCMLYVSEHTLSPIASQDSFAHKTRRS